MKKVIGLFLILGFFTALPVLAQSPGFGGSGATDTPGFGGSAESPGFAPKTAVLDNPLSSDTFCKLIKGVLDVALQLGIPVMVFFIVLSGFRFVWARGNPESLKKARENLFYTLIGIGIFLGAWALAMIIAGTINKLQNADGNPGGQISSC